MSINFVDKIQHGISMYYVISWIWLSKEQCNNTKKVTVGSLGDRKIEWGSTADSLGRSFPQRCTKNCSLSEILEFTSY